MIYILRFILPKKSKKEFTKWLKSTVVRLDGIASSPWIDQPDYSDFDNEEDYCLYCKPRFGKPLPPLVLNSMIDGTSINWEYESKKFLASLDYSKNRYLRSPKEMKKMGFKGEPYKL